jgi:cyclohexadienyl dehydratase
MCLVRLLLVLFLIGALASGARAQTRLDEIAARGVLRVGLTGDYRPFSLLDKATGRYSGIDVDLANSLAQALGVRLEIVPTKWADLINDVTSGRFDIGMGGVSVTLERAKSAYFSTPVLRTGKAAIARCTDKSKYQSLAEIDRPGVKVMANPGGTNERFDRAHLNHADIVIFPDNATVFDELVAGHADLMITDAIETRLQQKLHPELCAIHPDAPFDPSELAYLLPRDITRKLFVDEWLNIERETGAYQAVVVKFLE